MKRFVSELLLMILAFSLFLLPLNIRTTKASFEKGGTDVSSGGGSAPDGNETRFQIRDAAGQTSIDCTCQKQAEVVEHKISPLELTQLKRQIGDYDEKGNYSQTIGGHGTGGRPPTEREWNQISNSAFVVERILLGEAVNSPSTVDHTTKPWFPPIGDQDGEGSCTCWALGYYMKTFQEAKERNWDLSGAAWEGGHPSVEYQNRIISPDFIYHLINGGVDEGAYSSMAVNLICSIGACSWEKMPYDPNDHASWPSEEAWREAPLYRGSATGFEFMWVSTDSDLASLKNWIASDNLAATSVYGRSIYNGLSSRLTNKDMLTLDNYAPPVSPNHIVTIVGYDDNFEYTEQGQTRHGAFKIANSWGIGGFMGWENIPDGCFWISYEAMKQSVGFFMFYHDRIGYEPKLAASFRITHPKRGECKITVGAGPIAKSFSDYIDGGDQPFCPNSIFLDITEFEDSIPDLYDQQFYLEVYDGGSSATGTITKFSVECAESTDPPISTLDNGKVYAYVTLYPLARAFPLSASLYVGQSVTFASTVSGGVTPYSYQWYLNGAPVSGATSTTWTFTPSESGIYFVYLKVTDASSNAGQSENARIIVGTVPVGGYSIAIQPQIRAEPILTYIALTATLTAISTRMKPKQKRKR